IAGSWAIELNTNKKWKHTDLDIIALGNPVKYIDNALTKKEHCNGPIPIPPEYFHHKSSFRMCKNKKDGIMFYTPNLQLQLAFKLIGELDNDLSKRAISQLLALCHAYKLLKKENVKKELAYI
ncbi:MAG: hypothetical protein NTY48_00655, partial [Candidatus Diapherotrites archaeon]|nr:hypothetical protein [Candidatus Diapherotrites archaeon]